MPQTATPVLPISSAVLSRWGLATSFAMALMLVGTLLHWCRCGIDFSDEGYYLNWIAHPELYAVSPTQFGFVYEPLYWLVGHDLVRLRQANILIVLVLSWALFFWYFIVKVQPATRGERWAWGAVAAVLSTGGLTLFYLWLPTPSYNALALQGLLVAAIGLVMSQAESDRTGPWSGIIMGIGAWLTFMAKPTTALAAAVLFGFGLVTAGRRAGRIVAGIALVSLALLLLSAWRIDGSIARFIDRLLAAEAETKILHGNQAVADVFRTDFDKLELSRTEKWIFASSSALVFLLNFLALFPRPAVQRLGTGLALCLLIAFAASCGISYGCGVSPLVLVGIQTSPSISYAPGSEWVFTQPFRGVQFLAWPAGAVLAALACWQPLPRWKDFVSALCFFLLPYAFAFGTSGNYWSAMGGAAIFWCAAGVVLLIGRHGRQTRWPQLVPHAIGVLIGAAIILVFATEVPYRQGAALRSHDSVVPISGGSFLHVSPDVACYLTRLRGQLSAHGFTPGTPMLDLTGHCPTSLYLVEAKPLGLAWMIGGYGGSPRYVRTALDRVSGDDLRRAWLLSEPDSPRALSPELLHRYGLDLDRDYEHIGTVTAPVAEYSRSLKQHLYKPRALPPGISPRD